ERVVWPFRVRYLLSPIASGLLVVDQRAAHERVLYEKALAALDGGLGASQQLLFPFSLALPPDDRALLEELLPELRALGFDLALQKSAVEVRGVPSDVSRGDEKTALRDLLDRYRRNSDVLQLTSRENLARSLARRSALGEGQLLQPAEAKVLIEQLFACDDPFTDPSGRPTMVRIAESEIEQRFG
ncbi:MAG TPA: DNA mismatch repair protein MutL, partial [Rhodothermales bacterium]|nr:DNA mismatch repair protein MutL [Rhodothermales bacterium]